MIFNKTNTQFKQDFVKFFVYSIQYSDRNGKASIHVWKTIKLRTLHWSGICRYYAAFPALNQKSEPSYISTNINFVLDKWPSDKTRTDLITAKWITPDSSRKSKRKPPATMDNYNPIRRDVKRNKFGHKRTYCGRNLTRGMADNFNNWQRLCWYNENYDASKCVIF